MPSLGILLLIARPYLIALSIWARHPPEARPPKYLPSWGRSGYLYDVPVEMDETYEGLFDLVNDATALGGEALVPGSASGTTYKLCEACWVGQ